MKKKFAIAVSIMLLFAMIGTACGSSGYSAGKSSSSEAAYAPAAQEEAYWDEDMEMAEEAEAEGDYGAASGSAYTTEQGSSGSGEEGSGTTLSSDKLVYTCYLEIETTEYQKTVQAIREKIRQYNAIIESETENDNDYNWYYSGHRKTSGTMYMSIRIRVPVKDYDAFVTDAGNFGKVTSRSQNVENISRQYHSTEARIEALEKEEKRLNEMMDKADTIEEMIYIEERLTDVESELNANRTNLASMDVDVAYSTVNINVREVLVYTEEEQPTITFGQRVTRAFKESWEGFTGFMEGLLIAVIHLLPFIICGLIIVLIVVLLNKAADKRDPDRKKRRLQKKEDKKAAKERAKAMKMNRGYPQRPMPAPVNPPMPKDTVNPPMAKEPANTAKEKEKDKTDVPEA
ncbi:MAG: DUF4349 domain-containing protein [Lachnospiraceae bacterium]|nr:DUF4349 domain-containing protein [Lachnospiraceae bacterium]